ncbi:MAG: hypothetical protein KatS3mg034_0509 [Vicingaceae bacterium]|nr:MAG: hypothetical protein KatS3mg034_0509 [Vicingaceae bacterium]
MKISASIYSYKGPVEEIIRQLSGYPIDYFHVDCNDDISVFDDIKKIRQLTNIPIDLHIISKNPQKFTPYLQETRPEKVCYQLEDLPTDFEIPHIDHISFGIAMTTQTPVEKFELYDNQCDFVLIMATTPGQSGGTFNKENFAKIRKFKKLYPEKLVHVDGGVNAETSFILRNLGVYLAVSGSFLINNKSKAEAILDLKLHSSGSHYLISDFMTPIEECPHVHENELSLLNVLYSIENGKLGVTLIIDKNGYLKGIISNADIRRGLIGQLEKNIPLIPQNIINTQPFVIYDDENVHQMLSKIRQYRFPVSYLPVINREKKAVGMVHFLNLIKGEL